MPINRSEPATSWNDAVGRDVDVAAGCAGCSEVLMTALILWLLGVPLSIIVLLYLIF